MKSILVILFVSAVCLSLSWASEMDEITELYTMSEVVKGNKKFMKPDTKSN